MDPVWGFADPYNDFEQRQRSVTPFPGFTPPQSPEPPFPRHFREVAEATPDERAAYISSLLTPVLGPIDDEERCTICLDPLPEPTDDGHAPAVQLVCGHPYCRKCIMTWLLEVPNNSCPYCRRQLWEEPLRVTIGDDSDSEGASSTVGEEDDGDDDDDDDDGDTVIGDDGSEEGEDRDDEDVGNSGDEMDDDDHESVSVASSDGDDSEDDVKLGSMYVGGLRRSARHSRQ